MAETFDQSLFLHTVQEVLKADASTKGILQQVAALLDDKKALNIEAVKDETVKGYLGRVLSTLPMVVDPNGDGKSKCLPPTFPHKLAVLVQTSKPPSTVPKELSEKQGGRNTKIDTPKVCKFDPKCKREGCYFYHPSKEKKPIKPCRYGTDCKRKDCYYGHPMLTEQSRAAAASVNVAETSFKSAVASVLESDPTMENAIKQVLTLLEEEGLPDISGVKNAQVKGYLEQIFNVLPITGGKLIKGIFQSSLKELVEDMVRQRGKPTSPGEPNSGVTPQHAAPPAPVPVPPTTTALPRCPYDLACLIPDCMGIHSTPNQWSPSHDSNIHLYPDLLKSAANLDPGTAAAIPSTTTPAIISNSAGGGDAPTTAPTSTLCPNCQTNPIKEGLEFCSDECEMEYRMMEEFM